ncbi:hypothetical protein Tco_0699887 [Tanacetum coccineum]
MDDSSMTMEEYIMFEEEKARKRGKVFDWQTATYGKIRVDDDLHDLSSLEAEFPAIVINDAFAPQDTFQCKSQENWSPRTRRKQFLYSCAFLVDFANMALPPREQRHRFLRYEGLEYPDTDIVDFEGRLARIHMREVHRVPVFDFGGLPDLMAEGLTARMTMEHRDEAGVSVFTGRARRRMSWRQFILALGLHMKEEMQTAGFGVYWAESARQILNKGDLRDYWMGISSVRDFLGTAPSYTAIRDPILRPCHRLIACSIAGRSQAPEKVTMTDLFYLSGMDVGLVNVPYLLARYLRLFSTGRKSRAHIFGGQFVARLADHFGLLTAEILGGLTVIAPELPVIDMAELVRLQISVELDDTWAWVAMGPERQPDVATGAPPPPPPPAPVRTIPQRLGRLEEDVQGLRRDVGSLLGLMERSMTNQGRFSTWLMTCMTQLMDASGLTYQAFDGSFRGSSPATFQRRARQRTDEASTSTAQQYPLQPDP